MLSDKIWVTRKARIYAEKRLLKKAVLSQILMIVYSALLVFFSISNLISENKSFDMLSIFGSIAVLLASVLLASQRYTERSMAMRNCYIQLDVLCTKVIQFEKNNDTDMLLNCESEYSSILANIENHTDYDYLCLRYSLRNNSNTTLPPFRWLDHVKLIWAKFWRGFVTVICFVLPFLILKAWKVYENYIG